MLPVTVQETLPGPAELDRAVRSVLARPEFAERELPGFLQRLVDLYTGAREALWGMIADWVAFRAAEPVLGWIVLGLAALVVLFLLVHLGRAALRAWRTRERPRSTVDEGADADRGSAALRPATWEARAAEEATAGRLRAAAVALYRALLLRLDERGSVRYDPSKTPGDYRREAGGDAAAGEGLRDFLGRFEPIAFGGREVSPDGYASLAAAARRAGVRV